MISFMKIHFLVFILLWHYMYTKIKGLSNAGFKASIPNEQYTLLLIVSITPILNILALITAIYEDMRNNR